MHARLALLLGEARPDVIELDPERPVSIGRSRDNTVVLPNDEQASRLHARVYFSSGRWMIRDFGLNGTKLDSARIQQTAELSAGNEIQIGSAKFRFDMVDANDETTIAAPATVQAQKPSPTPCAKPLSREDLTALHQFMTAAVTATGDAELAREALQTIFYRTSAALAGWFNLDPSEPLDKAIWPEAGKVDYTLARQLTRRIARDHRTVWPAQDQADGSKSSGIFGGSFADAIAVPLCSGEAPYAALHLYKSGGYFSQDDCRFVEAVAAMLGPLAASRRSRRVMTAENQRLRNRLLDGDELVGDGPAIGRLRKEINQAVRRPGPLLLTGEPGSGKESSAREWHRRGPRSVGPFIAVNCGSLPRAVLDAEVFGFRKGSFSGADRDHPGLLAFADDGTIYFDEITELSLEAQDRLIQFLETKKFQPAGATYPQRSDAAVIAATHLDLPVEVTAGRFRSTLWDLLKTNWISIPPLREHPEDIAYLAQYFLDRLSAEARRTVGLTPAALHLLESQSWPGNVRRLQTVLTCAFNSVLDELIDSDDLRRVLGSTGTERLTAIAES